MDLGTGTKVQNKLTFLDRHKEQLLNKSYWDMSSNKSLQTDHQPLISSEDIFGLTHGFWIY